MSRPSVGPVTVHDATEEEFGTWAQVQSRALLHPRRVTDEELAARRRRYAGHRLRSGVVDGQLAGTFRSWDVDLPLPGGSVRADAISSVAVTATHRRRGVLRAMMSADLAQARERGVAVAVLIAAEGPIYGRYGFGPALDICTQVLDTSGAVGAGAAGLLRPPAPDEDDVVLTFVDEPALRLVAPAVYAAAAADRPGTMPRDEHWWDAALRVVAEPGVDADAAVHAVVARDASGEAVGYARWTVTDSWDGGRSASRADVADLAATTPAAHAALWRLLASLDLVASVRAHERPVGDVLPWLLLDRRRAQEVGRWDFLWIRVLDPVAALGARVASADGRGVVEVVDADGPTPGYAGGRLAWSAEAGQALQVRRTDAAPDVVVDVRALGSALTGDVPLGVLQAVGDVRELTSGAVTRLGSALAWSPTTSPTQTMF